MGYSASQMPLMNVKKSSVGLTFMSKCLRSIWVSLLIAHNSLDEMLLKNYSTSRIFNMLCQANHNRYRHLLLKKAAHKAALPQSTQHPTKTKRLSYEVRKHAMRPIRQT